MSVNVLYVAIMVFLSISYLLQVSSNLLQVTNIMLLVPCYKTIYAIIIVILI